MTSKVFVLNGPNLNMLGAREPGVYGDLSLNAITDLLGSMQSEQNLLEFETQQTNSETEAVTLIQQLFDHSDDVAGLIINPGAWTHYSYALRDALALLKQASIPVVEVHLSQTAAREQFRHNSVISEVVSSTISGMGALGYVYAYQWVCTKADTTSKGKVV